MASEGRRGAPRGERRRSPPPFAEPAGYERGPPPPRPPPGRERSPVRDPYGDRYPPPPARDPYSREPRDPARPPPPAPRAARDPYYDDPYRRAPPPDPYYDRYRDDPYRRDPYADPYAREREPPYAREPYYEAPPRKPPPPECVVVLMKSQLRGYGEIIERKVKALNVISDVLVISEEKTLAQQIEDISRKGALFAVVVNSQNEMHHSLTLNILHGSPQEHRNMPLDDAMGLINRSFEKYLAALKEKEPAAAPIPAAPAAPPAPVFLPPSKEVKYLLNLLGDNRQLTLEELDKVILYLRDRRDKVIESEPRALGAGDGMLQQQQQQELQTKILSILNGTGGQNQPQPVAPAPAPASSSAPLINFDNPSVQQALDNLIQSGPNLLRNITAASSASVTAPSSSAARDAPMRMGLLTTPPAPRSSYPPSQPGGVPPQMRGLFPGAGRGQPPPRY